MKKYFVAFALALLGVAYASFLIDVADENLAAAQAACKKYQYPLFVEACKLVDQYSVAQSDDEKLAIICQSVSIIEMSCDPSCWPSHVCKPICKIGKPLMGIIEEEACRKEEGPTCANYRVETSSGSTVENGQTVYISVEPAMPKLIAKCTQVGEKSPRVYWKLSVANDPGCYTTRNDGSEACSLYTEISEGKEWNLPWRRSIQGGLATVSWDGEDNGQAVSGSVTFKIRGAQPSKDAVIEEIKRVSNDGMWFAPLVAEQESAYRQFETSSGKQITQAQCPLPNGNATHSDGGFGIFQITKFSLPTCQHLWDWKANVAKGVWRLKENVKQAKLSMSLYRQRSADDNNGEAQPVPDHKTARCCFNDENIVDAVALKKFNGIRCSKDSPYAYQGVCNYVWWGTHAVSGERTWIFETKNKQNHDYVEAVCSKLQYKCGNALPTPVTIPVTTPVTEK